jgi:hypothetical protein
MISKKIVAGFLAVALIAGCQTRSNSSNPLDDMGPLDSMPIDEGDGALLQEPGLQASPQTRFSDLPLPVGVVEDFDRTYIFESKNLQIGRMVYRIKASVSEVARFYIREAARNDWRLGSVLQADGAELVFRKPGKRLQVMIRETGIARGSLLIIHLTPETGADD